MVATAIYSVTMVLWKETAFPLLLAAKCQQQIYTIRKFGSDRLGELDIRSNSALILGSDSKQVVLTFKQVGDLDSEGVTVDLGGLRPHIHHAVTFVDDIF